jgi:hypothetical protein
MGEVERRLRGKAGPRGARGYLNRRGGLGDRQGQSWRPGQAVARMGSGVSVRGRGMRGEQAFGGMFASRGVETVVPTVWSCQHVQVFDGG